MTAINEILKIAEQILSPILLNKGLLAVFGLIFIIVKLGQWLDRKILLSEYEEGLKLNAEKRELQKKYAKGKVKDDAMMPIVKRLLKILEEEVE